MRSKLPVFRSLVVPLIPHHRQPSRGTQHPSGNESRCASSGKTPCSMTAVWVPIMFSSRGQELPVQARLKYGRNAVNTGKGRRPWSGGGDDGMGEEDEGQYAAVCGWFRNMVRCRHYCQRPVGATSQRRKFIHAIKTRTFTAPEYKCDAPLIGVFPLTESAETLQWAEEFGIAETGNTSLKS